MTQAKKFATHVAIVMGAPYAKAAWDVERYLCKASMRAR